MEAPDNVTERMEALDDVMERTEVWMMEALDKERRERRNLWTKRDRSSRQG